MQPLMWFLTRMEIMQCSPKSIEVILRATLAPAGSKFWHISQEDMFMCFPPRKKTSPNFQRSPAPLFPSTQASTAANTLVGGLGEPTSAWTRAASKAVARRGCGPQSCRTALFSQAEHHSGERSSTSRALDPVIKDRSLARHTGAQTTVLGLCFLLDMELFHWE